MKTTAEELGTALGVQQAQIRLEAGGQASTPLQPSHTEAER
jgi:hypothetical protein